MLAGRIGRTVAICTVFVLLVVLDRRWRNPLSTGIARQFPCPAIKHATYDTGVSITAGTEYQIEELPDGTTRYQHSSKSASSKPTLLILTLIKDGVSYGHDQGQSARTFEDYLRLLLASGLDMTRVSLGLAIESRIESDHIMSKIKPLTTLEGVFPRFTLLLLPPHSSDLGREDRHQLTFEAQNTRRNRIAQLRNALTFSALNTEPHVLWLDADVNHLSPNVIQTMLAHSATNRDAAIITARCQEGPTYDYDKNAWAGKRYPAGSAEVDTRRNVAELIKGTRSDDLIPLSSVGGTILLIRSSLMHAGLVFPAGAVIGKDWDRDGWDGIETEGLCVLARDLVGTKAGSVCWVLGGKHYVGHTNF